MSEWKEYKLEEIAEVIGGGTPDTSNAEYWNGDIPWLTPKDLTGYNGIFISKGERYITKKGLDNSSAKLLPPGTVLLSSRAPIGYVAIACNSICTNQGFKSIICNPQIVDNLFMYYWIKNNVEYLQSLGTGTTFAEISGSVVKSINVVIPSLDIQHRIASILTSLDDKIDLLRRENATLEAMAETLFRQWFVVEAKEEWEEGKLGDWVVIKRGGSPRPINDYIAPSGYRWLKISDVTNLNSPYIFQTKEYIKESGLQKTVYLRKGSLVLSNSATPGIPKILCVDSCIHDGWLYFPKSSFSKIYLYLLFKYIREDLVNLGNGSIFTNLKTDILKDYKVVKPDAKTLENFDHHVQPIFDKLYSNDIQIQTLIQTRDGLLPRLMGGEIKI